MSIYQDLVELFRFEHKYNSVKRFVRQLKRKDPKQFDRLEFPAGEEAQVDYGQGVLTKGPSSREKVGRHGLTLVEGFFDVAALVSADCLSRRSHPGNLEGK